jgi:CheY-like chemotaxis protein
MTARPTILIVEDVDEHRQLVRLSIERAFDCATLEARDGVEGALMVVEHRPDVVLTDLDMPRMNGLELIAFIRRCPAIATTPIVVLTLRDTAQDRVDISGFGILAFLRKPFRLQQLQQALASAGWATRGEAGQAGL